jgi:hypothetical protein
MKKLVATIYLMVALIGPSFAQDAPAVGKRAKPKQSSECRLVGTVKGAKLWAGIVLPPNRRHRQWLKQNLPKMRYAENSSKLTCCSASP